MRLSPWRRILAPKDKRKMVYAITVLEFLRLELVSRGLTVLTDWLTNPPRNSQIGPRSRRSAADYSWLLGANRTILIRSVDGRRFIPRGPGLQDLVVQTSACAG